MPAVTLHPMPPSFYIPSYMYSNCAYVRHACTHVGDRQNDQDGIDGMQLSDHE